MPKLCLGTLEKFMKIFIEAENISLSEIKLNLLYKVTTATLKSRNYLKGMWTMLGSWTMSEGKAS